MSERVASEEGEAGGFAETPDPAGFAVVVSGSALIGPSPYRVYGQGGCALW